MVYSPPKETKKMQVSNVINFEDHYNNPKKFTLKTDTDKCTIEGSGYLPSVNEISVNDINNEAGQNKNIDMSSTPQQPNNLENRVSAVEGKVDHLDRSVDTLNNKVDYLNKKVDKLDNKFDQLNSKVSDLDKGQVVLSSKFDNLDKKVDTIVENNKSTKTTIIVTGISSFIGILAITISLVFSVQSISRESSEKSIEAIKTENEMIFQQMEADRNQFERALEYNLSMDQEKEKRHEEVIRSLRQDLEETKALNQSKE